MDVLAGGGVTSAKGYQAGSVAAGIKKTGALDLCIVASDRAAAAAGVFTTNMVRAAPVDLCEQRLQRGRRARAFIVNAGNANACTGQRGWSDAAEMARLAADKVGAAPEEVLVASTGVIGVHLPMDRIRAGVARIELSLDGGAAAAQAIMTTDLRSKEFAVQIQVSGATITIGGMSKGSGMIHPNMATLLAFVTTDAAVEPTFLQTALKAATDRSFNMITVDGDTSTNDTLIIMANGAAGNRPIAGGTPEAAAFQAALDEVTIQLAKAVARDGEGATKLIEVRVNGALTDRDARLAARGIASSSLLKTAVYGADPNWGRIICALGYSGASVDSNRTDIAIGDVWLMHDGKILSFDRESAVAEMAGPDVIIRADLHLGSASAVAWGCDLTEQYVEINGKYTT